MRRGKNVTAILVGFVFICVSLSSSCTNEVIETRGELDSQQMVGLELDQGPNQSPEEALEEDLALIAEARGWTIEEARASREAADAVGRVAVKLEAERPEIFVGSIVSDDPLGSPILLERRPV
jgi:hypothetical protein